MDPSVLFRVSVLLFALAATVSLSCAQSSPASAAVPRFAPHEVSFRSTGRYANPYVELIADATLTEPDGRTSRTLPLFWDGGETWRFRFAPDKVGTWKWAVKSGDRGLDGQSGTFECVASNRRGSIQPMAGAPRHFQYQNGDRTWFLGDTAWAYVTDSADEKHDRAAVERYVSNRARDGFNVIHFMLLNEAGWGNRNGPPWSDIGSEKINPAYFQEADVRIAYANGQGITTGIAVAWGNKGRKEPYAWDRLPDVEARRRFARYAAARFSAYEVYFLVSGEWHAEIRSRPAPGPEVMKEFVSIGDALRAADPHCRMTGIHPMTGHGSTREFNAASSWMDFGDYQQNYRNLHARVLESRSLNKPVVNSEYAYWLRDTDGDGRVDKEHSYTLEDIRAATWDIVMAGGYLVAGFGSTYMGGNRHPTTFLPDDPKNAPWAGQIGQVKNFFSSLEYWKLEPHDELVTSNAARTADRATRVELGHRNLNLTQAPATTYWCLAEPGKVYVAYVRGSTEPVTIALGGRAASAWQAEQFDPRTGARKPLPARVAGGDRYEYRAPDAQDWLLVVRAPK